MNRISIVRFLIVLLILIGPVSCGDGSDGESAPPSGPGNVNEAEPNNAPPGQGLVRPVVVAGTTVGGTGTIIADDDYFSFTVTSPTNITITLQSDQGAIGLYLLATSGAVLAADETPSASKSVSAILDPGTYWLWISPRGLTAVANYSLAIP